MTENLRRNISKVVVRNMLEKYLDTSFSWGSHKQQDRCTLQKVVLGQTMQEKKCKWAYRAIMTTCPSTFFPHQQSDPISLFTGKAPKSNLWRAIKSLPHSLVLITIVNETTHVFKTWSHCSGVLMLWGPELSVKPLPKHLFFSLLFLLHQWCFYITNQM